MFSHWKSAVLSQKYLHTTKLIHRCLPTLKGQHGDGHHRSQIDASFYSCLQSKCYGNDIPFTRENVTETTVENKRYFSSITSDGETLCSTVEKLTDLLQDKIIFQNDHVVAINKPSELSLHIKREGGVIDEVLGMSDALPSLRQKLGVKYLEPALGINRKYSGIILLAKSKEVFQKLRKFYTSSVPAQQIPAYTFWGLTIRIPEPQHGVEKFVITKKTVGEHTLTYVVDEITKRGSDKGEYLRPFVKYEVLDRTNSTKCALVEFKPTTSKWDVLPLFIVKQLATLLGDHVYSSRLHTLLGKPVFQDQYTAIPQTQILSKLILGSLEITKNDVEKIPLHLHLKRLTIPKLSRRAETIEIEAPLPDFFIESMNRLGFSDEYSKMDKVHPHLVDGSVVDVDEVKEQNLRTAR